MSDPAASALSAIYQRELLFRGWQADAAQLAAVARLERLRADFRARQRDSGLFNRLRRRFWPRAATDAVRGVYLWGGVGRGKTWLMDLFFASIGGGAQRQHFHQLMRELHAALASIGQREAPIDIVARRMARRAQLWCLDELQVNDIADAMLLGTLFESLLRAGVTLVFTSNVPPAGLYRDGLQRARFLPAIALLEQKLDVLEVDAGTDYRLRQLRQASVWFDRNDPTTPARFAALFAELAGKHGDSARHLLINGRHITAQRRAGGVVCFSFATLCGGARSADDYGELADAFHTVFVSDIPLLDATQDDAARRLISLVDEFYDRGVKLIASAAAVPAQLYRGERLAFEFRRSASRLVEMQSEAYLARGHVREPGQGLR